MSSLWHVGPMCMQRLTTPIGGESPIVLLLSPDGFEYAGTRAAFINEALKDCRLCRILKDFLVQTKTKARLRRQRLQTTSGSEQTHFTEYVRFVLHLSRTQFTISAPDVVFSGALSYRPATNANDPVAQFLPNVVEKLYRGGWDTFERINSWISRCNDEHPECMQQESALPARLLDLSGFLDADDERKLQLYISRPYDQGRYAALSYCWGYSQPVVTTHQNLFQHLQSIRYDSLPQTLQDAIRSAGAIGLKYLWIDALCIIQDSKSDKEREIAKMAQIYQNASVTIVAACATSSAEGFLEVRDGTPAALEIPVGCGNDKVGTLSLLPRYYSRRYEALHNRAWTLQEIILSPRLLIFGKDSVGWKCTAADNGMYSWTDWNGYCASTGLTTLRVGKDGAVTRPAMSVYSPDFSTYRQSQQAERLPLMFRIWKDLIKDYSMRSLTNEDDKLNAIAGIVTYFQKHMDDVYLVGFWKNYLLQDLSWKITRATKPSRKRAPSWSWMALDGPVSFQFDHCGWYTSIATVISCSLDSVGSIASLSSAVGGALVLSGYLYQLPTNIPITEIFQDTTDVLTGYYQGIVWDCEMNASSQFTYFGLANCAFETREGHDSGSRLVWGLVLQETSDCCPEQPVYERVGWFSSSTELVTRLKSEVTIV
ncbi:heterokaryon incompatibility protein-domain-containing protein [Phaeosphaeria sp. MPI-PUGE-AT-0046c]|nr:heterokaryon incompatibility protein-domain-containing protein [Phaeosphaeria sp. MPI-PUGE-AT-0046c]